MSKAHVFLSPHFDDAIGSAGGLIKRLVDANASVCIMTVMGAIPYLAKPISIPKVMLRWLENAIACRCLGRIRRVNGNFLDAIFRKDIYPKKYMLFDRTPLRESKLIHDIAEWIRNNTKSTDIIYAPAGLGGHVDHRIVAEAARLLPNEIIFYEEFYYDWKNGETIPEYQKIDLIENELWTKFRAIKKYKIEMRKLFKRRKKTRDYFLKFRNYEKYSDIPHIPELIVTLTSIPARINMVHLAIKTIFKNSVQPNRVVLYLAQSQFPDLELPESIKTLMKHNEKFEVRWTNVDIRSYKKLVPALSDFPEDFLITIDDDLLYKKNLIYRLIRMHKMYPDAIIGARTRRVAYNNCGEFLPYNKWKKFHIYNSLRWLWRPHYQNMATTGAGTLFPPYSLHPDVVQKDIFMDLCQTTDDLWFWAMAVKNQTKTAVAGYVRPLNRIEGSQVVSLFSVNNGVEKLNDKSIKNITVQYPEIFSLLKTKTK